MVLNTFSFLDTQLEFWYQNDFCEEQFHHPQMLMEIMKHCAHTNYADDHLNLFGRNFERSKFEDFEPPKLMSL